MATEPLSETVNIDIYNEDCVAGMRKLPTATVDVTVTSPPYNIGVGYSAYRDQRDQAEYHNWCEQWGREVHRVLKREGSLFLNVGGSSANPLLPHAIAVIFSEFFVLQNTFVWVKSITVEAEGKEISTGHFKPINSPRYVNSCHEFVFHFTKNGSVPIDRLAVGVAYQDKSNLSRWSHTLGFDRRCRGSCWYVPYETITRRVDDRPHPATFPTKLAANCINLHGMRPSGLTVLDPFMGLASTGLAAQQCGATRFIGYEIDPAYFAFARQALGLVSTEPSPQHEQQ